MEENFSFIIKVYKKFKIYKPFKLGRKNERKGSTAKRNCWIKY